MDKATENRGRLVGPNRKQIPAPLWVAYTLRRFDSQPKKHSAISNGPQGCILTSTLLGDMRRKLSGLASLNINDSTLNWDPRLITSKKSTPNTLANSLHRQVQFYSKLCVKGCPRRLCDHFGFFQKLKVCDHSHLQMLIQVALVDRSITAIPVCQGLVAVVGDSVQYKVQFMQMAKFKEIIYLRRKTSNTTFSNV